MVNGGCARMAASSASNRTACALSEVRSAVSASFVPGAAVPAGAAGSSNNSRSAQLLQVEMFVRLLHAQPQQTLRLTHPGVEVRVQTLDERVVELAHLRRVVRGHRQLREVMVGVGQRAGSLGEAGLPFGELVFQPEFYRGQAHGFAPVHVGLHERDLTLEAGDGALGFQPTQFPRAEFALVRGEQMRPDDVRQVVRLDQQAGDLGAQALVFLADGIEFR